MFLPITEIHGETGSGKRLLAYGKRFGHTNEQDDNSKPKKSQLVTDSMTFMEIKKGRMIGLKPF